MSDVRDETQQTEHSGSRRSGRARTEEVATIPEDEQGPQADPLVGMVHTCNECGTPQQPSFSEEEGSRSAAQWVCGACSAVNTARFFENTEGGVERQIQHDNRTSAIFADEDWARRTLGDDEVDRHLQERQEREDARQQQLRHGEELRELEAARVEEESEHS